jgi:hypothetical protein
MFQGVYLWKIFFKRTNIKKLHQAASDFANKAQHICSEHALSSSVMLAVGGGWSSGSGVLWSAMACVFGYDFRLSLSRCAVAALLVTSMPPALLYSCHDEWDQFGGWGFRSNCSKLLPAGTTKLILFLILNDTISCNYCQIWSPVYFTPIL